MKDKLFYLLNIIEKISNNNKLNKNIDNELNNLNDSIKNLEKKILVEQDSSSELELKSLENRKLLILTSPLYLINVAKEHINNNEYENSRIKINELFGVIDSLPFVSYETKDNLETNLTSNYKKYNILQKRIKTNEYSNNIINKLEIELSENEKLIKLTKKNIDDIRKIIKDIENEDNEYLHKYKEILTTNNLKYLEEYNEKINKNIDDIKDKLNIEIKNNNESKRLNDIEEIKLVKDKINFMEIILKENILFRELKEEIYLLLSSLEFDIELEMIPKKYLKVVEIITLEDNNNISKEILNDLIED